MDKEVFLNFKKLLNFVWKNKHSDFYRLKFKKAGFNPVTGFNSLKDIEKIPFLTKEELVNVGGQKLLFVPKNKIYSVAYTGGTTGEPIPIFRSSCWPEFKQNGKILLLAPLNVGYEMALAAHSIGDNYLLLGDIHNLPASCSLAQKLGIDTVKTTPTLAIILKSYLERYPDLKKSLKYFLLFGELLYLEKKKFLKKLYPGLKFISVYGSMEIGVLGIQCQYLAKIDKYTYYHTKLPEPYPQHFYEVIAPDTDKRVNFGKKGELVITNFWNLATPMIRYKTGDLVSFKKNDCPCGTSGHLLAIHGRINYDFVRAGGFELHSEMLERPLLKLNLFLKNEFEAHIYETFTGNKPRIKAILNLSLKEDIKETVDLKQKIENELLENWQLSSRVNFKKAVEVGLFEPLQINFVKFPKSPKPKRALILH